MSSADAAPDRDLESLLQASGTGDRDAFAALYDAAAARVHGLVRRIVRDQAHAEEVTQEVFLEIWRSAPSFDPCRGGALSWMLTTAHRRAVDRVRSAQAQSRRDDVYESQRDPGRVDPTADEGMRNVDSERIREALAALTDVQRAAVELAYWHGRTHREIAEQLGIPIGTAKTRIRDGLIRLRTALREEADDEH